MGGGGEKKKKSITAPSGAGSEVNKVLDKCVSGMGTERESGAVKGSLQCVCFISSGQEENE